MLASANDSHTAGKCAAQEKHNKPISKDTWLLTLQFAEQVKGASRPLTLAPFRIFGARHCRGVRSKECTLQFAGQN